MLFGTRMGSYTTSENTLAKDVLGALDSATLCLADRGFFGFEMWQPALATQAQLLWRSRKNMRFVCGQRLADGSCMSRIHPFEDTRATQSACG